MRWGSTSTVSGTGRWRWTIARRCITGLVTTERLLSGDPLDREAQKQQVLDRDFDVYLNLVQIMLAKYRGVQGEEGHQPFESGANPNPDPVQKQKQAEADAQLGEILELMVESCEKIDPAAVLDYLPGDVPLSKVIGFVKASFSHNIQERKKMSILKSLTKQEALQVRSELISHQKQSVVVHPESVCRVCYKRIQNSVFILDNDGRLVHFVCHRRIAQKNAKK